MSELTALSVYPTRLLVDSFLLVLVWLPVILFATVIEPFERGFYCEDVTIRYPYKDSTVPNWVLYLIGAILPIIAIIAIETFRVLKFDPRIYKQETLNPVHQLAGRPIPPLASNLYIYLGYFIFGAALCQGLTDLGKYTVGRLRPHFIAVCNPAVNCSTWPAYKYVEDANCRSNQYSHIREARLSFPSGHSSFGAFTMIFLVLYIQSRLIWPMVSLLVKHVLQNLCVVLAAACALSRVSDYKHHWSDVLAGVILGVIVACLTAFHMVGLFRYPHRLFSYPYYSLPPMTSCSFGGDHFHSSADMKLFGERWISKMNGEQNLTLVGEKAVAVAMEDMHNTGDG